MKIDHFRARAIDHLVLFFLFFVVYFLTEGGLGAKVAKIGGSAQKPRGGHFSRTFRPFWILQAVQRYRWGAIAPFAARLL